MLKQQVKHYELEDIFNFDETALFYRLQPNKTLASHSVKGDKVNKERLTIALCTNVTGTFKCKAVVIGRYMRPRCFGKVWDPNNVAKYYYNLKAWMTMDIFKDWLVMFDVTMKRKNKKVLLIIDNATGHNTVDLTLDNVNLLYLPANTTSYLQPLDAGIIKNFKCNSL